MLALFADTAGWGNLVDPTQSFHSQASCLYRTARLSYTATLISTQPGAAARATETMPPSGV